MAEPEELLLDETGLEEQEPEERSFDDEPEFALEDESEITEASKYTDDILNADPTESDLSLLTSQEIMPSQEIMQEDPDISAIEDDSTEDDLTEDNSAEAEPAEEEPEFSAVKDDSAEETFEIEECESTEASETEVSEDMAGPLSNEETESIELLLSETENAPEERFQPRQKNDPLPKNDPQPVEKIDTEVFELQHSLKSLHQQQAHQLEMSLLERVDDLIKVLEKRHKPGHSPEQLPHKQFATALHYISNEQNHYLGGKWLRKAAMQGHGKAQLYLGMLFVQGNGVPKSLFHAYAWFSLAVCQNIDEAKGARKKLEPHLTAKEINSSLRYAADILDKIHQL